VLLAANGPRSLRVAAEHASIWNTYGDPGGSSSFDLIKNANATLDGHCRALGRDPSTLRRSLLFGVAGDTDWANGDQFADLVRRLVDIGITDFIYYVPPSHSVVRRSSSPEEARQVDGLVEEIATAVVPRLRSELS
jgi:alkanesulfonate monooxygenase SsuD/methylene tetrahydromethanopterin reductase-like flavin-dependent oxidoreductase (luciferase family)